MFLFIEKLHPRARQPLGSHLPNPAMGSLVLEGEPSQPHRVGKSEKRLPRWQLGGRECLARSLVSRECLHCVMHCVYARGERSTVPATSPR